MACDSSMQHCVPAFVRLRIFRCVGETTADECCGRKKLPCAEYSVVKDQHCRNSAGNLLTSVRSARHYMQRSQRPRRRWARDSRASFAHRNFFKEQPAFARLACQPKLVQLLVTGPPSPRLRWATYACIHERRLVENTGLEPVTSWLQTRRSPS